MDYIVEFKKVSKYIGAFSVYLRSYKELQQQTSIALTGQDKSNENDWDSSLIYVAFRLNQAPVSKQRPLTPTEYVRKSKKTGHRALVSP